VDNELEVIRHQMEAKRASLADKLDTLENDVLGTVHAATSAATGVVQEVKATVETVVEDVKSAAGSVAEGVQGTVESVKETLDFRGHIRKHPWLAMGGAFAAGFAGAFLLGGSRPRSRTSRWARSSWDALSSHGETATSRPEPARSDFRPEPERAAAREAPSAGESSLSVIGEAGMEALHKVKGLAVGALMGVLGEVVTRSLPEALKSETSNVLRDLTTRLGGKVLDTGSLMDSLSDIWKGAEHEHGDTPEMGRTMGSAQRPDQGSLGEPDRQRAEAGRGGLRANDRPAERANGKEQGGARANDW
jgi:ElaB/YqjD/DUF883 family membrane-anchored ribosome-binding protein